MSVAAVAGIGGALAANMATKNTVFTTYYYLTAPAPALNGITGEQKRFVAENWVMKGWPAANPDINDYGGIVGSFTCPMSAKFATTP